MSDKKNEKKKYKRKKRILILEIILILIACIIAFGAYIFSKLDNIDWDDNSIYQNDFSDSNMKGYTNIALFGVDSRENDLTKNTRSDSIIIASINKRSKKVKLVSIYRDTYVYIPEHGYTKLNHAYAYGGPKLAVETINRNFDMNITDFVTVNFSAVTDAVDALSGITIDITEDELNEVNRYAKDVARINNKEWSKIKEAGSQTLTGVQATGYCRVRYTKGGDFTRAERQRKVVEAILDKAKHSNPVKLANTADKVLPQICTGLSGTEFTSLALSLPFYHIEDQCGFPFDKDSATINKASVVVSTTLSSNVTKLHEYLFGTNEYKPSETVTKISSEISQRYR